MMTYPVIQVPHTSGVNGINLIIMNIWISYVKNLCRQKFHDAVEKAHGRTARPKTINSMTAGHSSHLGGHEILVNAYEVEAGIGVIVGNTV